MSIERSLNVLCLTNMWPRSDFPGYGSFVHSQVDSLAQLGVRIRVHMVDGRRSKRAYPGAALRFLQRNLADQPYDLVHAHTGHCGALAVLQRKVPVVVSFVGYDIYGTPKDLDGNPTAKSRWEAKLFHQLPRYASGTITKSQRMADMLPPWARSRNLVLPNGVDRQRFRPIQREAARARLGWPQAVPIMLFAGNPANPRKRYDVADATVTLCRQTRPDILLKVCWGVTPEDVPYLMSAADLLVHPSVAEGSPNVVKEALACNLPVIGTDVGDIPELMGGVLNCHVVDRTPEAFAAAALNVMRSGHRSDGRARSEQLASERIAKRVHDFYRQHARARQ